MRWLVLTQRSLLRRDDKVWVGGWFGMGDLFLTQGALLCWDDNFGGDCFGLRWLVLTQGSLLRRDDNFGWVLWNEVVGTYAEVPPSSG